MRTRHITNWLFFALALSLHLALLASAYLWNEPPAAKRSPPTLTVDLISPAAPPSPMQSAAAPPQETPRTPERTPPKAPAKPKPAPKRAAAPPKKPATIPKTAKVPPAQAVADTSPPAPAYAPPASPAPLAESAPNPPPAPATQAPAKTGISLSASYIATETQKWYPNLSKRYGEQGTVVVRVHVSAEGNAERVELKKRSDYPLLDEAAIGLAKSLQYNPARADGNPVPDWVDIPITFRLSSQ